MSSLLNLLIIASCLSLSHAGMTCQWGDSNILSQTFTTCPKFLDSSDKEYCCVDTDGSPKCCNLLEFALTYIIIAAVVIVVLSIVCCLVSCFCCPCCFCYKRRHGNPI